MKQLNLILVLLLVGWVFSLSASHANEWIDRQPQNAFLHTHKNSIASDFKIQRIQGGGDYQVEVLPSGRVVKIMGLSKMHSSDGKAALMLRYLTEIKLDNVAELRKEAEDIWSKFRNKVEKAGLDGAILSATTPPEGWIIKTSKSYNFLIQKNKDGQWEFSK